MHKTTITVVTPHDCQSSTFDLSLDEAIRFTHYIPPHMSHCSPWLTLREAGKAIRAYTLAVVD